MKRRGFRRSPVANCCVGVGLALAVGSTSLALDRNNNQQSDVWEMMYGATGLVATVDTDGDGVRNAAESVAGTDPRNGASYPFVWLHGGPTAPAAEGRPGKLYQLQGSSSLDAPVWPVLATATGNGATFEGSPCGGGRERSRIAGPPHTSGGRPRGCRPMETEISASR